MIQAIPQWRPVPSALVANIYGYPSTAVAVLSQDACSAVSERYVVAIVAFPLLAYITDPEGKHVQLGLHFHSLVAAWLLHVLTGLGNERLNWLVFFRLEHFRRDSSTFDSSGSYSLRLGSSSVLTLTNTPERFAGEIVRYTVTVPGLSRRFTEICYAICEVHGSTLQHALD